MMFRSHFILCKLHFVAVLLTVYFCSSLALLIQCKSKYDKICYSTTKYSYCDEATGFCKCLPLYLDLDSSCVARTKAFCDEPGLQCVGLPKSHCSRFNRCSCNAPFVDNGTDCVHVEMKKVQSVDRPATIQNRNFQYNVNPDFDNPATGIAEIMKIVENQLQQNQQRPSISLNLPFVLNGCLTNSDCLQFKNNHCFNGRCECLLNYVTMNGKCYPGIGTKCSPEEPCFIKYSMCDDRSLCSCKYGFRAVNGQCRPGVGNVCSTPMRSPCFNVPNSFCNQRFICSCIDGFYETQGLCSPKLMLSTVQQSTLKVGDGCTDNNVCTAVNSYCNESKLCDCLPGYTVLFSTGICAPSTIQEKSCSTQTECTQMDQNSLCTVENRCICKEGFVMVFDHCYPVLNHPCSDDLPCAAANSFCSSIKLCKCKENFREKKGVCEKVPHSVL